MISTLATCYLFLGGVGAGGLAVLSLLKGVRALRACPVDLLALPRDLLSRAWILCTVFLALGTVCIAIDLGRFDNVLVLLTSPRPVPLAVGAYALALSLVLGCTNAWLSATDIARRIPDFAIMALSLVGAIAGSITMTYTGLLLTSMVSVVAWHSVLVPVIFSLSSLSCGLALILLAAAFTESRRPQVRPFSWLLTADSAIIACEAISFVAYVILLGSDERSVMAQQALVCGDLAIPFWCGVVGVGLALPWFLERIVTYSSHHFQMIWIAAAILVGGFLVRWCVVSLAAYDPAQEYSQFIQGIGQVLSF